MWAHTVPVLFVTVAETSRVVAATSKRSDKAAALAELLRTAGRDGVARDEVDEVVAYATGTTRRGRVGVGWATIDDIRVSPAADATLTIDDLRQAFDRLADSHGEGAMSDRRAIVAGLLAGATESEQSGSVSLVRLGEVERLSVVGGRPGRRGLLP